MSTSDIVSELENKVASDGSVDYLTLNTGLELITDIGEFVLGLLCVIFLMVIPLVVMLELFYINIPILRTATEKFLVRGNGHVKKAIEFTLQDAKQAITEANTVKTGRSATWIYFGIKLKWILIVMIALGFTLSGVGTIVSSVMKLIKGIIDVLVGILS